jgi:predicted CXXCH cytochrome family protein
MNYGFKLKGTRQMLIMVYITILLLIFLSEFAYAKVSGVCSGCHTMHNSQNNTTMQLIGIDYTPYQNGIGQGECQDCHAVTRAVLLRLDCLGCHAYNINGNSNIIPTGGSNWPQIALNTGQPYLAGGNYKYVFSDDSLGHNVHGFGSAIATDSNLGNSPPGYNRNYDPSSGGYQNNLVGQIMCAGQNGCHGNRDQIVPYLAMRGTHHADDSILKFGTGFTETGQGATVGTSYRFLYKVHGAEDLSWQANPSSTVHNEYKGSLYGSSHSSPQTWSSIDTISEFCAECHGSFHLGGLSGTAGIGGSSPWLRHPTDVVLPNSGEYSAYHTYSVEAPVARQNIPDGTTQGSFTSTVTPGTDIVMCLSCHRAHASQYPDILRWDYSTIIAGGGGSGGCFTCHTQKNTNP